MSTPGRLSWPSRAALLLTAISLVPIARADDACPVPPELCIQITLRATASRDAAIAALAREEISASAVGERLEAVVPVEVLERVFRARVRIDRLEASASARTLCTPRLVRVRVPRSLRRYVAGIRVDPQLC